MQEQGARFTNQQVCEDCFSTAVMDKKRLKQVIHDVRKFFKQLKLKVDKHIPISLMDEEEMTNNAFNIKVRLVLRH